ncbi:MAG: hypothetical protein VZQ82_04875, partial [Lachnospiraceae bacterium]|nr:hypothetical protein [Lachnospiraceae bacterium]
MPSEQVHSVFPEKVRPVFPQQMQSRLPEQVKTVRSAFPEQVPSLLPEPVSLFHVPGSPGKQNYFFAMNQQKAEILAGCGRSL